MELITVGLISLYSLRVILTCLPQTGYIHPDEFFQSVEVTAGDILNVEGVRTWEFNSTSPLRSAVIIHAVTGFPLYLLQLANIYSGTIITSYEVLVVPRLFMTLLSFSNDFVIWKLSKKFGLRASLCLLLFASSYLTLVFYTRTLSNTTETLLFNLILLFTASGVKSSSRVGKSDEDDGNKNLGNMPCQIITYSAGIGLLVAVGLFNRPTFLSFAFVPVFLWLIKSYSLLVFVVRVIYLTIGFIISSLVIICLDTVYYKHNFGDLELDFQYCFEESSNVYGCVKETVLDHFIVAPWNFVKYNSDKKNLKSHGAHPWYLHLTVNSLILFGPMTLLALNDCIRQFRGFLRWKGGKTWSLLCIFYFPIMLLSLFPHQEPRFIIPLLTPAVLMMSQYFRENSHLAKYLTIVWTVFNVLGVVMFGFLHQGGIVQTIFYLNQRLGIGHLKPVIPQNLKSSGVNYVIYSGTYMPPEHLLIRPKSPDIFGNEHELDTLHIPVTKVLDLKGADVSLLKDYITSLKFNISKIGENSNIFIVTTFTRVKVLCESFSFQKLASFFPHLSMEDPPDFGQFFSVSPDKISHHCFPEDDPNVVWKTIKNHLSLFIVQLK